ncbi:hypothetical protein HanIR_Chr14g0692151 [Helianthus annuus]|nr:hypothetical protein HanIR_Chr14g0692151 [Helianthus annuus]
MKQVSAVLDNINKKITSILQAKTELETIIPKAIQVFPESLDLKEKQKLFNDIFSNTASVKNSSILLKEDTIRSSDAENIVKDLKGKGKLDQGFDAVRECSSKENLERNLYPGEEDFDIDLNQTMGNNKSEFENEKEDTLQSDLKNKQRLFEAVHDIFSDPDVLKEILSDTDTVWDHSYPSFSFGLSQTSLDSEIERLTSFQTLQNTEIPEHMKSPSRKRKTDARSFLTEEEIKVSSSVFSYRFWSISYVSHGYLHGRKYKGISLWNFC